ncbi:AMP-binding enzyme [Actinophytocola glycyrrhizae]|uniref:AMP-binding enzyme C-terminal domain-containing protein n=1 Tax=Actinophytocola glycyrrhizae TaxID=2044873 RepID=A0ABV9RXR9_9PSEU
MVSFDTHPDRYRHWTIRVDGDVAWLVLDVDEQGGLTPGYELKLNSYDLADALVTWCRAGLAAYKRPRAVVGMAELPKTATGKIRRNVLRELVADELVAYPVPT